MCVFGTINNYYTHRSIDLGGWIDRWIAGTIYIYIERDKVDQDTHVDTFRYMYISICTLYIYL